MDNSHIGFVALIAAAALALAACSSAAPSATPDAAPQDADADEVVQESPLEGAWTVTWTPEDLLEALGGEDAYPEAAQDAEANAGTTQLVFEGDEYDFVFVESGDSCPGTFTVEGDRVMMTATSDPTAWDCGGSTLGQLTADAAWSVDGDSLTLTDWNLSPEPAIDWFNSVAWGAKPFERVE